MILDPFAVLGLGRKATDEEIRGRYLELVRRFPPDRHPARFQAVREAYELIRDGARRLDFALFYVAKNPDLQANVDAIAWKPEMKRPSSEALLDHLRPG